MNCGSCGRAHGAGARFCGGCGRSLALRCPACGAEGKPDAQFCEACGGSLAASAVDDAAARKIVTIVFADLVGSTALRERLDAESVHRFMDRYYRAMQTAVEAHGGTVTQLLGDGVMFSGAPTDVRREQLMDECLIADSRARRLDAQRPQDIGVDANRD